MRSLAHASVRPRTQQGDSERSVASSSPSSTRWLTIVGELCDRLTRSTSSRVSMVMVNFFPLQTHQSLEQAASLNCRRPCLTVSWTCSFLKTLELWNLLQGSPGFIILVENEKERSGSLFSSSNQHTLGACLCFWSKWRKNNWQGYWQTPTDSRAITELFKNAREYLVFCDESYACPVKRAGPRASWFGRHLSRLIIACLIFAFVPAIRSLTGVDVTREEFLASDGRLGSP